MSFCEPCPPKHICPEEGMSTGELKIREHFRSKKILAKSCPPGLFGTDPKENSCTLCEARFSFDENVSDREINHGITPCKLIPDGFYLEKNVSLAPCDFDDSCFIQVLFLDFTNIFFQRENLSTNQSKPSAMQRR